MKKNLYVDFDGVICNTIEITYSEIKEKGLDYKKEEDQAEIRKYYEELDWNDLLNNKAIIINDSMNCINKIIDSNKFEVFILTHVNSLHEVEAKVDYIRKYLKDITIIPVPRNIPKTSMVHADGSILIDDYAGNLEEWKNCGGLGIKFATDLDSKGFIVIDKLDQILDISAINED